MHETEFQRQGDYPDECTHGHPLGRNRAGYVRCPTCRRHDPDPPARPTRRRKPRAAAPQIDHAALAAHDETLLDHLETT